MCLVIDYRDGLQDNWQQESFCCKSRGTSIYLKSNVVLCNDYIVVINYLYIKKSYKRVSDASMAWTALACSSDKRSIRLRHKFIQQAYGRWNK